MCYALIKLILISREVVPISALLLVGLIYAGKNDLEHQATMLRSAPYSLDGTFHCLHL